MADLPELWLEVSNVRTESANSQVQVQLKADRRDKEPSWWRVQDGSDAPTAAREIFRAMDSKKIVLARIKADSGSLVVDCIRIQFSDSGNR